MTEEMSSLCELFDIKCEDESVSEVDIKSETQVTEYMWTDAKMDNPGVLNAATSGESFSDIENKLTNGTFKLQKPSKRSAVWEKFSLVVTADAEKSIDCVICDHCKKLYRHHAGTTSNMLRHKCLIQTSIQKIPLSQSTKDNVCEAAVQMCALDLRPFSIIEGKGFQILADTLIKAGADHGRIKSNEVLPSAVLVSLHLKISADNIRTEIIPEVRNAISTSSCAMTIDIWFDRYRQYHYYTVTSHYINPFWKLIKNVLYTTKFSGFLKSDDKNITEELENELVKLGIHKGLLKKVIFVSNNNYNITAALDRYQRLPCSGHSLNTILIQTFMTDALKQNDSFKEVVSTLESCKHVVEYVKETNLNFHLSREVYRHVQTRWNSQLKMLQSIQEHLPELRTVLAAPEHESDILDGYHENTVSSLIDFLKPFQDATEQLESENLPTLHLVLLWQCKLQKHCTPTTKDSEDIKLLKSRALSLLGENLIITKEHKIATFLWPPFCKLMMLSNEEKQKTYALVRHMCSDFSDIKQSNADEQSQSKKARREDFFSEWLEQDNSNAEDEVSRYVATAGTLWTGNVEILIWWRDQQHLFPSLAKLAQHFLSVPATSTSSEQNLSKAGIVCMERLTRLHPTLVDDILCIHNNSNFNK